MKRTLALSAAVALALTTAACAGQDNAGNAGSAQPEASPSTSSPSESMTGGTDEDMAEEMGGQMGGATADPASALVGPGCAAYAEQVPEGDGSVSGMAQDPVATAASNNPLLGTLVDAVSGELNPQVDLVDSLNGAEDVTVFAPVDDAFAALDPATLETLGTPEGAETLNSVLTYHVVTQPVDPSAPEGTYETLQGGELTVSGSGDEITVNTDGDAPASVICGGVQTANATVYLVDGVLMPTTP